MYFRLPIALLLMLWATSSQANDLTWSFAEHPHPSVAELTEKELTAIEQVGTQKGDPGSFCENALQADFGIYNTRNPAFSGIGDEHTRFSAWKRHIVARDIRSTGACVINDVYTKLIQSTVALPKTGLIFCGKYTRETATPQEKQFAELMDELVDYAQLGSPNAMSSLLAANSDDFPITLNADVEYFLRKSLEQSGEYESRWGSEKLKQHLTAERAMFLDQAAESQNLKAVLETTSNCTE